MTLKGNYVKNSMLFLSCASSFVFDYITRQKQGGAHLTLSVLKQLPVPSPHSYRSSCKWDSRVSIEEWILPRVLELTYTAWDLEKFAESFGYRGTPFLWNNERRFLLQCELDAAYFHLYGIEYDDVNYVMETFPGIKHRDERQHGEYRTKNTILEIYKRMHSAIEMGEPYQTLLQPNAADPSLAHSLRLNA